MNALWLHYSKYQRKDGGRNKKIKHQKKVQTLSLPQVQCISTSNFKLHLKELQLRFSSHVFSAAN